MTKHYKLTVALLTLLFSAFFSASAANTGPTVIFIGDNVTLAWPMQSNWINEGVPTGYQTNGYFNAQPGTASATLARFQADVIDRHPAIVHIMIGPSDADLAIDSNWRLFTTEFLTNLDSMVKQARDANIQVILGLEPSITAPGSSISQLDSIIATYGAQKNIPVINYEDALCECVSSAGASTIKSVYGQQLGQQWYDVSVTPAGYAVMTQMAEAAINTVNANLEGGYLQNVEQSNDNEDNGPTPNVNTVYPAAVVQFTPYGYYSNGQLEPFNNDSFAGSTGTWASSNPLVMYVNQQGLSWSLSPGTAIITYTSPTGVKFSEWIMYIIPQN